jgi:hypothetical protein
MFTGPNIITDGLVLKLDAANVKSFKGEPTTNLISNPIVGDYGNSPGSTNNTTSPDGSNNATIPIPDANADRYQISIAGGNHPSGTQFTYSWHYKQLGPHLGTSPNEPGGLLITGLVNCTLVGTATKLYDLNDGWSRWKATFQIVDGSLESIFRLYFGFVIGINGNSAAYYGHQFEQKIYATPFVIGTRGTTVATGGGWGDTSGNNNHGELINGPTYSSANGGSIVFDGVNDVVTTIGAGITDYSQPFSMGVWFYIDPSSTWDNGFRSNIYSIAGSFAGQYGLFKESGDIFGMQLRDADSTITAAVSGNLKGIWYYLISTWDGSILKLYRNGELVSTNSAGGITGAPDTSNLYIGGARAFSGATGNFYQGNIAKCEYYNRSLTAQEIFQNYNATKSRFNL